MLNHAIDKRLGIYLKNKKAAICSFFILYLILKSFIYGNKTASIA